MSMPKTGKAAIGALLAVTAVAGLFYINRPESASNLQSTDNAYVRADYTQVSPQVSGRIAQVLVEDNQRVTPGRFSQSSTTATSPLRWNTPAPGC